MKQILVAFILAIIAMSAQAEGTGDAGFTTSGRLYETCQNPAGDYPCTMFILGVMQGMDAQAYLLRSDDQCIPLSELTNGDLKNIVTGFLANNKGLSSEPAATSVILALGSPECRAKLMPQR